MDINPQLYNKIISQLANSGVDKDKIVTTSDNDVTLPKNTVSESVDVKSFYNFFGYELSHTTIYIIVGFICILVAYFLYKKWCKSSSSENDSRKQETSNVVSHTEQNNISP